jgi:uncharacterized heparinase superfamily protein
LGLRGGLSDGAFAALAVRQGLKRAAAGANRLVKPFGSRVPQKLLIAPQDIRTTDPTIAAEIYAGHLKFAGKLLETHGRSPFDMQLPSQAFAAELHGFGWLRHLKAADSALARANGRALVADWIDAMGSNPAGVAGTPEVTARRLISWLSQTPLLLEGADASFYRSVVKALTNDADRLVRARSTASNTDLALLIEIALTHFVLSSSENDAELRDAATELCLLLDEQVLSDGGHVSRNPQVIIDLLLDLLPLKLAFLWRRIQTPQPIVAAIDRMMPMLRMLRHTDGAVALFNGMGATRADLLAAILAQDDVIGPPPQNAPYSGYQRVERGASVLLVDAAKAPAPPQAARCHAAPGAFEFSSGGHRIFVNCGAPPPHRPEMRIYSRATAAHNTLITADDTIGRFARSSALTALVGEQFAGGAKTVNLQRADNAEGSLIAVDHDGYLKKRGVIHARKLLLTADGERLEGEDTLKPIRQRAEFDYALRFHLHPLVRVALSEDRKNAFMLLPSKAIWQFEASGYDIELEETIFFASTDGLRRSEQLVIRAHTGVQGSIAWSLRKTENK